MAYHLVDEAERRHIHRLRQADKSDSEIAELLGRNRTTVWREVRRTLLTLVGKTASKHAAEVTAEIVRLLLSVPGIPLLSLTLDNGKAFAFHEEVMRAVSLAVFFAHPYHSWERGTNENTNGLLRRVYPKGSRS